jgi:hypothetical protein
MGQQPVSVTQEEIAALLQRGDWPASG